MMSNLHKARALWLGFIAAVALFLALIKSASAVNINEIHVNNIVKNTHLSQHVIRLALRAYNYATLHGKVSKPILTIIDYTQPSVKKRLFVINLQNDRVLMNILVAHGRNTGDMISTHFSNTLNSKQSSVGVFVTEGTYLGHHGKSMVIDGLEKNINDNAKKRGLVVHSAAYVSEDFVHATGRIGRSFGCIAVNPGDLNPLIKLIAEGSVIFSYAPQEDHDPVLL